MSYLSTIILIESQLVYMKNLYFSGQSRGGVNENFRSSYDRRPGRYGCHVHYHLRRASAI